VSRVFATVVALRIFTRHDRHAISPAWLLFAQKSLTMPSYKRSLFMKKTWKVMAIAIMLVFSIVSVFAAGRTENATKNTSKSGSSEQTETVAPANQSA